MIIKLAPGDPGMQMTFNPRIKAETREKMRRQLGLDRLIAVQYLIWLLGNDRMQWFGAKIDERAVTYLHAGCNALIPIARMLGPQITGLLGGAVITETIWSWPGLGRMFVEANFKRDYPVVLAGLVIGAIAVILGNMLSDVLYAMFDPRIRLR